MKALPIHDGAFTVLMIFECGPGESERFANELAGFIESRTRFHPGFLSSLVYLSEDARKVVETFQWARAEDWEAYRASDDGQEAVRWLAGRTPNIQFLELIRAIGAPPPGHGD
jgi:heme-degrading monooxygenase HmoA